VPDNDVIQEYLAVPVFFRNEVLGVLHLTNERRLPGPSPVVSEYHRRALARLLSDVLKKGGSPSAMTLRRSDEASDPES
jgi:hypothetical protein